MDREQLLEILSTTLLWEVISKSVEKVNQLPIMLEDISYIEDKDNIVLQIKECEVFESETFDIIDFTTHSENILITFEMPFVLSAWSVEKQLLRIIATATGKCRIPDIGKYDWYSMKIEDMRKEQLLANKELIDILELSYTGVECDDLGIV